VIGSLRGHVVDRDGTELLVEVAGIGHRVSCTPSTAAELGAAPGEVFVWIHHQVREDAETLYGFSQRDERTVFETLVTTHGVGPALALAILSVHSPKALRLAIATDDIAALCLVPGVGRKTAARLLVELKSRLDLGDVDPSQLGDAGGASAGAAPNAHADVRDALTGLGYGPDEVAAVLRDLPTDGDPAELLRRALSAMGSR